MGTPPFLPGQGQGNAGNDAQVLMQQIMKMIGGAAQPSPQGGGPTGVPGAVVPPPAPNIRFDPSGAPGSPIQTAGPRPAMQIPQTGNQSLGKFTSKGEARNAGLVSLGNSLSGIFSAVEAKDHAKKAAMAENYLMQINSLIASGDPNDRKKAEMFLEDPKIRKILKTGLDFVPLEEKVPPEAEGVQAAVQKIQQKQGQPPPPPQPTQMRPVLPQPGTQQKLQQAMQSAILQAIQKDPAKALSMMGASQLSSAETRAAEFYQSGLGLSPAQVDTMSAQEKLTGLKVLESSMRDILRLQSDIYKTDKNYSGRVDSAKIMAGAKRYAADKYSEAAKGRKGAAINLAAGAKIYKDMAQEYTTLAGKTGVSDQDKAKYLQMADKYNGMADDYLNRVSEDSLMDEFMKGIESEEQPEE